MTNDKTNPRYIALLSLVACDKNDKYTNLEVNASLSRSALNPQDRALYTALVYGVAERSITLDYVISKLSSRPVAEIDSVTLNAIRLGLYQMMYMDRIPAHAAVSESVNLAEKKSSGFVNAVLRNYLRKKDDGDFLPSPSNKLEYLSIKYSAPKWLCALWSDRYDPETAESLLAAAIRQNRKISLAVNTNNTTRDAVLASLRSDGIEARASDIADNMIVIDGAQPVSELSGLADGAFYIQDEASGICVNHALSPTAGDVVIDACAAPGGKSLTSALKMNNTGKIISCDINKNKLGLLEKSCIKFGITIVETLAHDGKKLNPDFVSRADKVLCDVPCSGLGVIAKKPDIRYKTPESIDALPEVQYDILKNCANYVKDGGTLVYSTCTLNPRENEEVVTRFLSEFGGTFEPCDFTVPALDTQSANGMMTLFPHVTDTDGFFIAKMKKVK